MDVKIKPSDLQSVVESMLRDYGDKVYVATDEGLAAAEKVLIGNLKAATPKVDPKRAPKGYEDKKFRNHWKSTKKKYKLMRFVGNTTTTEHNGKAVSLANILEYSEKHGHPFIKNTFENSIPSMAEAVVSEIKKEVQ